MPALKKSPPRLGADLSRLARWWLGQVEHSKALKRSAFVQVKSPRSLADRFAHLLTPWSTWTYPGAARFLAAVLNVGLRTAEAQLAGRARLPEWHLRRLVDFLSSRIAEEQALLFELRAALEREQRRPPNLGYMRGLRRWRYQQAQAKKAKGG